MKKTNLLVMAISFASFAFAQQVPQLGKASIEEVVKAMTLEEKALMVRGKGMNMAAVANALENGSVGATEDRVQGAAGTTFAFPRLGIPTTVLADGPAGLRISPTRAGTDAKFYSTAWPIASLQASSWDVDLVHKIAQAYGAEAQAYGVDVVLAPGMNIQRNTLNGRNFEYYSEDPLLSGKLAAAFTKGIQSNDGVGVSIKHFVANNQEKNRNSINNHMTERSLREIYLRGFEIAVKESDPFTVMSSYNRINGVYTSEDPDLLTDILRNDWGFNGYVMTDWWGGKDPILQMKAGNDILMPGNQGQTDAIIEAVKNGTLDEKILDRNVANILKIVQKSTGYKGIKPTNKPDLTSHAILSRESATEGMILLKNNDSALPIESWKTVALFGVNSYDLVAGGTGSGNVHKPYTSSLETGLLNNFILVDQTVASTIKTYIAEEKAKAPKLTGFMAMMRGPVRAAEMAITKELAEEAAKSTDIGVLTIGRNSGEGRDREVENDFELSELEQNNIEILSQAFKAQDKKFVILINAGGTIEIASWRAKADAILMVWQAGLEGGNAIAEVVSGKVNPSGKTPMTFPIAYEDMYSSKSFPGVEDQSVLELERFGRKIYKSDINYDDGIYVGYRYFDKYNVTPAYEFGFGLSYTSFEISDIQLSSDKFKDAIDVTVKVTNTGDVAGKEVVQIYLSAPESNLHKPVKELRSFGKTSLLEPGASQTMTFTINARDLTSFDEEKDAWIADKGTYTVQVGNSSRNIIQSATFSLNKTKVVEKTSNSMTPKETVKVLN